MDFWSQKQSCRLPFVTSRTPEKHQKNPSGTKPTLVNMVKAVTTRSGTRKTPTIKETEKPQPLEPILDKGETSKTTISNETTKKTAVRTTPRTPQ